MKGEGRERETEGPRTGMFFLVKEEEMEGTLEKKVKKDGEQWHFVCLSTFSLSACLITNAQCVSLSHYFNANLLLVVTVNAEKGSLKLQLIASVWSPAKRLHLSTHTAACEHLWPPDCHSSSITIPTLSPLLNSPLCSTLSCHCHSAFTCLLCEYWAGRAGLRTLEIRVQGAWTHPSGGIPQVLFWQWDRKEGACCLGQMRERAQLHRRWS